MEGGRRVFLWLLSLWWDGHGWASIEREGPRWVRERGVTASGPQADRRGRARENGKLLSCVVLVFECRRDIRLFEQNHRH